eukprot:scaffold81321_cov17-Tisochrysis_lutea.AAC.1
MNSGAHEDPAAQKGCCDSPAGLPPRATPPFASLQSVPLAHALSLQPVCSSHPQVDELFDGKYTVLLVEDTLATEEDMVNG